MKVLIVNWSWYPTGGDWTYVENLTTLYESHGYEIIPLSTLNEKNIYSKYENNFINGADYKLLNKNKSLLNGVKALRNSIISRDALKKVDKILVDNPEIKIAHLHNIHHHITPAIIWRLKKAGVRVIWSLHDYKIICPDSLFVSNEQVCERCITGKFYNCALNKCKKDSFAASSLAAFEAYFYHSIGLYNIVDAYLCPSEFIKKKFVQFGFDESKFFVTNLCYNIPLVDNYIREQQINSNEKPYGEYILCIGRIETVKGIQTLVEAVKNTGINLKVVGTGSLLPDLEKYVSLHNITNIEFCGFKNKMSVFELTYNARFVVCPSIWYENFPFSIIESFLFYKPVIGSNIGGIRELVIDGETGLLFEPGNVMDLRSKLLQLWNSDIGIISIMGEKARQHAYKVVNFEMHWLKLQSIIDNVLNLK